MGLKGFFSGIARYMGDVSVTCLKTLSVTSEHAARLYPGLNVKLSYGWRARDLLVDYRVVRDVLNEIPGLDAERVVGARGA